MQAFTNPSRIIVTCNRGLAPGVQQDKIPAAGRSEAEPAGVIGHNDRGSSALPRARAAPGAR